MTGSTGSGLARMGVAYCTAFTVGAGSWLGIANLAGVDEAWDSAQYFTLGLPGMLAAATLCGWLLPLHRWHFAIATVAPQLLLALSGARSLNLLPLSIGLFAAIAALLDLGGRLGVRLARRLGWPTYATDTPSESC